MFWTAFIVLLVLCLMGLSIQIGWVLIHFLLAVGLRGCRAAPPADNPTQCLYQLACRSKAMDAALNFQTSALLFRDCWIPGDFSPVIACCQCTNP